VLVRFLKEITSRPVHSYKRDVEKKGAFMRRLLAAASLVALGVNFGTPARTSGAPVVMAEPAALNTPAPSAAQIASEEKAAQIIKARSVAGTKSRARAADFEQTVNGRS
jgi:hypothetical protein